MLKRIRTPNRYEQRHSGNSAPTAPKRRRSNSTGDINWTPAWTAEEGNSREGWQCPSPVMVPKPLKLVPVICRINRQNRYKPTWEYEDLFFYPGQTEVPIVLSDSMCRDVERHPTAVHIIRSGATVAQLIRCFKDLYEDISNLLPIKIWVILIGGGNDLCWSNRAARSRDELSNSVIYNLKEFNDFCKDEGIRLTISHVMPRPLEQGKYTPNCSEMRHIIAGAYMAVNDWIKKRDEEEGEIPLILSRFLEYKNIEKRGQIVRKRVYETGQQKIRESRFAEDGVHLAGQGVLDIQGAIIKLIEANY